MFPAPFRNACPTASPGVLRGGVEPAANPSYKENSMKKMLTSLALVAALLVAMPVGADNTGEQPDIVDTAVAAGSFNTLVAAVQAAGLVDALKGDGPFTVFAPTDEAFAKLPEGTIETLLKPENLEQLQAILTYHVVPAQVLAADVADGATAPTLLADNSLSFDIEDGNVFIGDAQVVQTDIVTSNGVIHVIDSVLLPN